MTDLRRAARNQPCILCGSTGTTVLHHLRIGNPGMGRKPPDTHGIEACHTCHEYFHGEGMSDYKLMLLAHLKQIDSWMARGLLPHGGEK